MAPPPPGSGAPSPPERLPGARARSVRAIVGATVMLVLVAGAVATASVVAWRTYRDEAPAVPHALKPYEQGTGFDFTTKQFSVRLPDRFETKTFVLPLAHGHITMSAAIAVVDQTVVVFASGRMDRAGFERNRADMDELGAGTTEALHIGGFVTSSSRLRWRGLAAVDLTLRVGEKSSTEVRVVADGQRALVFIAASPSHAGGVRDVLVSTYEKA